MHADLWGRSAWYRKSKLELKFGYNIVVSSMSFDDWMLNFNPHLPKTPSHLWLMVLNSSMDACISVLPVDFCTLFRRIIVEPRHLLDILLRHFLWAFWILNGINGLLISFALFMGFFYYMAKFITADCNLMQWRFCLGQWEFFLYTSSIIIYLSGSLLITVGNSFMIYVLTDMAMIWQFFMI